MRVNLRCTIISLPSIPTLLLSPLVTKNRIIKKPGAESGGLSTTIPRSYNSNSRITFDSISSKRNTMICRYCKKPGHQIERCYKLHGFLSATSIGQPKFKKSTAFAQVSESQQLSTSDSPTCNTSPANSSISKEQFE